MVKLINMEIAVLPARCQCPIFCRPRHFAPADWGWLYWDNGTIEELPIDKLKAQFSASRVQNG